MNLKIIDGGFDGGDETELNDFFLQEKVQR